MGRDQRFGAMRGGRDFGEFLLPSWNCCVSRIWWWLTGGNRRNEGSAESEEAEREQGPPDIEKRLESLITRLGEKVRI